MANQRNLTKFTVQEALNKEHYTAYSAAYDDSIDLNTAAGLVSASTFPTAYGEANIFAATDARGVKLVYSKVSIESDGALEINLADKNGTLGPLIYVIAASLPITFTGYDITDVKIKTAATDSTLGIIAWR